MARTDAPNTNGFLNFNTAMSLKSELGWRTKCEITLNCALALPFHFVVPAIIAYTDGVAVGCKQWPAVNARIVLIMVPPRYLKLTRYGCFSMDVGHPPTILSPCERSAFSTNDTAAKSNEKLRWIDLNLGSFY